MNFTIGDILNLFSQEEAEKVTAKYFINVVMATENPENTKNIFDILSYCGLTFKEAIDIRVLSMKSDALKATIELWRKADKIHLIENSISYLRYKADLILSRILLCDAVGKSYLDEYGKILSFVLNDDEWNEVKKGLNVEMPDNLSSAMNEEERKPVTLIATFDQVFGEEVAKNIETALVSEEAELTDENFDRYTFLVNAYHNIIAALSSVMNVEVAEFYIKNLITYTDLNDIEIVKTAIIGSGYVTLEDLNSMEAIINEFCNSRGR